jgi:protein-L-isoaspartate(D-aspartate) O-methyltransferase
MSTPSPLPSAAGSTVRIDAPYSREQMVSHQLRTWDVLDEAILDAVRTLPREVFAPAGFRDVAYADIEIPLAHGQRMLAPKIVGRILQSLAVKPGERVLEIGTGSGYLTACLARLGAQVTSVEVFADLADAARRHLAAVGLAGPRVLEGDALAGGVPNETFDAIAITGSMPNYDDRFESLLRPGGRLFVVVGEGPAMDARLITRPKEGAREQRSLFETQLGALVNAARTEAFRF